jgi:phosphatidylserine/phosphatidylglycerophosphate/cardiolipin synthase-like enzyme
MFLWLACCPAKAMTVEDASNTAELLVDGHEILPVLLDDLRAARSTLHISVFLWFRDPIGEELAELLIGTLTSLTQIWSVLSVTPNAASPS